MDNDIEVDCEVGGAPDSFRVDQSRFHLLHSEMSSKKFQTDEQVDSGLSSMGYLSADSNLSSIPPVEHKRDDTRCLSLNASSSILDNLSKLNISNAEYREQDRFDSGHDSTELLESDYQSEQKWRENWVSPSFQPDQIQIITTIFSEDEDGDNQLHMSIIHEVHEITMQIIGLAPSSDWLNDTNNLQQTALHLAVLTRQVSVLRRLMCAGASLHVPDLNGNTPLHIACKLGYDDVVRALLKPVERKETLQNKYQAPIQTIPQDLELKNYEGLTCLHLAAHGGHINIMQLLLSAGANINTAEGKSGRTVLHFAVDWANLSMVRFLVSQRGVDVNARTYAGLTPLLLAQGRQNPAIANELMNNGAVYEVWAFHEDSDEDIADEDFV